MTLALRHASEGDAALLLRWRNDPVTRAASFSDEAIPLDTHRVWLARRLADPACAMLIAERDGEPVAQVRLERVSDGTAEVHVVVAPEARGMGVARDSLRAGTPEGAALLGASAVVARVKEDNAASLRAFRAAGYEERARADGVVELIWTGARRARPEA